MLRGFGPTARVPHTVLSLACGLASRQIPYNSPCTTSCAVPPGLWFLPSQDCSQLTLYHAVSPFFFFFFFFFRLCQITYNSLIAACSRAGAWEEALKLFESMKHEPPRGQEAPPPGRRGSSGPNSRTNSTTNSNSVTNSNSNSNSNWNSSSSYGSGPGPWGVWRGTCLHSTQCSMRCASQGKWTRQLPSWPRCPLKGSNLTL